ncbi:MAG: hypothetical protein F6K19_38210 [Cyanothece sp. SIO1E1]|nr:hypothetical protein [Cyanothece sp. SIO1E1]
MTSNQPLAVADDNNLEGILSAETRNVIVNHVVLPGALGGVAKITWELTEPPGGSQQLEMPTAPWGLFSLVPANMFLGIVSALIGTLVLTDVIDLKKSKLKIFGLSLVFGLFFPIVFEAASTNIQLQNRTQLLEAENNQLEQNTQNAVHNIKQLAAKSEDADVQQEAIENIKQLAAGSSNADVQASAIDDIQQLAAESDDVTLQQGAIDNIKQVAEGAEDAAVQTGAITSIKELATESDDVTLQQGAIDNIKHLAEKADIADVQQEAINSLADVATTSNEDVRNDAIMTIESLGSRLEPQIQEDVQRTIDRVRQQPSR